MCWQVRAAFHEDGAVQRNNFSLLKVFIAKWQTVPPPLEAIALHITAGGPQASKGTKGRLPKPIADQRTFGLRIFAAGTLLLALDVCLQQFHRDRHSQQWTPVLVCGCNSNSIIELVSPPPQHCAGVSACPMC